MSEVIFIQQRKCDKKLFLKFVNNFFRSIVEEGFTIKKSESDVDIIGAPKFVVAARSVGGAFCYLTVINSDDKSAEELQEIVKGMEAAANEHTEYFSTVYSVFVFAGEKIDDAVFEMIGSGEVFERQKIYNIYWGVSLSDFKVFVNENQPSEMYGIRLCIDNSLEVLKNPDISLDDLRAKSSRKGPLEVKSSSAFASLSLMFVNAVMTASMLMLGATFEFWIEGAVIPERIWGHGEYYRLLTAMFIHANLAHLASNLLGIYIFGSRVERYFGQLNFLIIYFGAGLLGSVFSLLFTRGMSAGASGAVYGLIGAVAVKSFISRRELDGISSYIVAIWIIIGFVMSSMVPGIDAFGHLGGLLGGALLALATTRSGK